MVEYAVIENEKLKPQTNDNIINLALQTLDLSKQVLVFNNSKRSSEKTGEDISKFVTKIENQEELQKLSKRILKILSSPTKQCRRLAKMVEKGIAFHHSGLASKQRTLIESGFKEGIIKLISSTPTLAAGLNLPAYKVIIKDYKRYSQRGYNDIPILEFHQMSGRAGRPGKEEIGKAVICVKSKEEFDRIVPKYVFGKPEEIISKLAVEPTLKMYMLSLVAMDFINTEKEIVDFFSNTFYAHQYEDLESLKYNLFRILKILEDYKFIRQTDNYFQVTPLGKKVSQLYLNPDTANYFYSNLDKFIKVFSSKNVTRMDIYSLLYFVVDTIEMRPLFRVSKSEEEDYVRKSEEVGDDLILKFDPFEMDFAQFLNMVKTTDILFDWINEAHEDYISDKYKITPGELNYKVEVVDWLFYCLEEMSTMKKNYFFKNFLNKLRQRFKFGIKDELLSLISLKGIGRVRARKLFNSGLKNLQDLEIASFESISKILSDNLTIKIKNQLKENIDILDRNLDSTPKEIKVREVSSKEVESLVSNYEKFEKEVEKKQKNLLGFF